ncbi:DUF6708 domain-containing protein [Pseudomonas fluorescens]|uniref:DUF6708 domain-containing protein n=1 Tax=Pseudomonas fluorescens TaxID=294 RepID=UPI003F9D9AF9
MYLYEWCMHWSKGQTTYEQRAENARNLQRKPGQAELHSPEGVKESISAQVTDNESVYAYNETYLDIRTPNDEKRGLITLTIGGIGGTVLWGCLLSLSLVLQTLLGLDKYRGESMPWDFYLFAVVAISVSCVSFYLYFKYVFPHLRLEAFTSRRLIIRFNRITQKVYLLRPPHVGGTLIMDWDKAGVVIDKAMSEAEGTGGFVILGWDKGDGMTLQGKPTEDVELAFIGKPTRSAAELLAFWEYIRRYMECGLDAAPRPQRLICKFPWPWNSFKAAWRLDTSFLGNPALWLFISINLLLLPVILIHGFFHWISLLLCYEPRFPKAIEQAGQPSKSAR